MKKLLINTFSAISGVCLVLLFIMTDEIYIHPTPDDLEYCERFDLSESFYLLAFIILTGTGIVMQYILIMPSIQFAIKKMHNYRIAIFLTGLLLVFSFGILFSILVGTGLLGYKDYIGSFLIGVLTGGLYIIGNFSFYFFIINRVSTSGNKNVVNS